MAKRIKRFFVFLLFSLCFSLVSGRQSRALPVTGREKVKAQQNTQTSDLWAQSCHRDPPPPPYV